MQNAAKQKFEEARTGRSTSGDDKFKTLRDEQDEIKAKQATHKSSRQTQQDKHNQNEAQIKKLIAEQKDARGRAGFKSVEEIDAKIDSVMKQVDSGTMKLVDEKKALADVSSLRRQKKGFSGMDDIQKQIDTKKAENVELKKTFDNAESRALSDRYEAIQKELDEIKASRGDQRKNMDGLRADRDKLQKEQQETYQKIRQIKDDYFSQRKAYKEHEDQVYQQRRERQKAERDSYEKERRRRVAEQKLEEAGEPAFLDQIRTAEGLLRHFDSSYGAGEEAKGPGEFAATTQRDVDESGFKGMKVLKKDEEDFFTGSGGKKKGKGGKKGGAATNGAAPEGGKLNLHVGILSDLGKVGVEAPSSQADVPAVVEKLKEKLAAWKKDQDTETQKVCYLHWPFRSTMLISFLECRESEEGDRAPGEGGRRGCHIISCSKDGWQAY